MKKFFAFSLLGLGIFFAAVSLIKPKGEVIACQPDCLPPVKAEVVKG
jgi:hypothetical protein